jgi:hypothetical protein
VLRERDVLIRKNKNFAKDYETKEKSAPTLQVCKMVRNAKKDRDDIDKNKNQIRAIASFLQNLTQLLATPETVAVPQLQI